MMKQWRLVILSKFGKQAKRSWFFAAVDFQLVDFGIKPVCLFDHWAVSPDDMQSFIQDLVKQHLIINKVHVLSIGLDVIIYRSSLDQNILTNSSDCRHFVDVSLPLLNPKLADHGKVLETTHVFIKLCDTMNDICNTQDLINVFNVEINDGLNVPCLYGLLLGYPCVYWYDVTKGDEHCLSGQLLQLFQVKGQLKADYVKEKSINTKSFKAFSTQHKEVNNKYCHSSDCHVIFSFTVPTCLLACVQEHIESWFYKWKDLTIWSDIFYDVWLERKSVNPPSVCL